MNKKINFVFATMAIILFYSISSYANDESKFLIYNIDNSEKTTKLIENKSSYKVYEFNNYLRYLLKDWSYSYCSECDICPNSKSISRQLCNLDIKEINVATSLLDIINEVQNTEQYYQEASIEENKQQLTSSNKLFVTLDSMAKHNHKLFIPELMPIIEDWDKCNQIPPIVYLSDVTVNTSSPNNIKFNFYILTTVDTFDFNQPEDQQFLTAISIHDHRQKSFEILGDYSINMQTKEREIRLFTTSNEVLFKLNAKIDDNYLSKYTLNDAEHNINFAVKEESKIQYERESKESVAFHERETYTLINNLKKSKFLAPYMYNVYLASPTKHLIRTLNSISLAASLQDIIKQSMKNKNNIEQVKLISSLAKIKEKNYNLFIPDLIPLITKWGKRDIIHPLVKIYDISTEDNTNEVIIHFSIQKNVNSFFFKSAQDIQYLSAGKRDTDYNFKINGVCKIDLQSCERTVQLLNNSGEPIHTSESF